MSNQNMHIPATKQSPFKIILNFIKFRAAFYADWKIVTHPNISYESYS